MSPTTTPVDEPQTALPSAPSDELWTADSERQPDEPAGQPLSDPTPAPSEAVAAEPEPTAVAPDRDEAGKFRKGGKPRDNPYARVQQATAKEAAAKEEARQAREEAAALKARLDALEQDRRPRESTHETQRNQPTGKPSWKDFEDRIGTHYQTWAEAQDAFFDARETWAENSRAQQQTARTYLEKIAEAKANDPALAQALQQNDPPVSSVMEAAILSSKNQIDIVRYLSSHPEDCAQLARESVNASLDAVPVMRRLLESQVTAGAVARPDSAPSVRPSTANPPINRVGGTASATPVDPDDLPFGPDYIRAENAKEKKRQEASRW